MSTPEAAPADATIIRQVLAGHVNAFALLVDRYHARCLRVATHLLGDSDDAEDAVQDAFVRAYRHLGSFRPSPGAAEGDEAGGDRFGAWMMRIVVNQCRTRAARSGKSVV